MIVRRFVWRLLRDLTLRMRIRHVLMPFATLLFNWRHFMRLQFKLDVNPGSFVIINSHLAVILVVVWVIKKCDPLAVSRLTSCDYDLIRNSDSSNELFTLI